jgi:hypothetical protein
MKNVLIYISPTKSFNNPRRDLASNDAGPLVKIQIENSLALGWKPKDIMLVTNFDTQYAGIKAKVLRDVEFFDRKPQASKINAIVKLFEKGLIKKNDLYWFHDMDAFQLEPIKETEIKLKTNEIALTDFGGAKSFGGEDRWSTGTIFFKSGSEDLFKRMKQVYYDKRCDEEEALGLLVIGDPKVRIRVKKINATYNFIGYKLQSDYKNSMKPVKVVHFHPLTGKKWFGAANSLSFFKGENKLGIQFISNRLLKIFRFHRIK